MPPLELEVYHSERQQWIPVPRVNPGDRPGSVSQNLPDGKRELYIFECAADDSHSTIYKSPIGMDIDAGNLRAVLSDRSRWEITKVLQKGDQPFILTIGTDISLQRRIIRFTHK